MFLKKYFGSSMMGIENKMLFVLPALDISVDVVREVRTTSSGSYEIVIGSRIQNDTITLGSDGKDFVGSLKKGDQILFGHQGSKYLFICGPVNEGNLYNFK